MKKIFKKIKEKNSIWKFKIIRPYIKDGEKILDFGCGDMGLSSQIIKNFKKINVVGIDVIPMKKTFKLNSRAKFVKYNGDKIPFKDKSFDTIIAFYVLHHCADPNAIIQECVRVAKNRILIIESIPHRNYELPFMKFFDFLFNILKFDMTPLPYKFYTVQKWKGFFKKMNAKNTITYHPKSYEDYFPFGKMYILEFEK